MRRLLWLQRPPWGWLIAAGAHLGDSVVWVAVALIVLIWGTPARAAVDTAVLVINQVFAGAGEAKTVNDDLFVAFLWGLYVAEGWMR